MKSHRVAFIATISVLLFSFVLWPLTVGNAGVESKISEGRPSVKPLNLHNRIPTTEELMAAGQLGGQLYPTHELRKENEQERVNLSFGRAIQAWNRHEYKKAVKLFKKHIEHYPHSPWASEAALHIGCEAQYNGRYGEAEQRFTRIIERNRGKPHRGAKFLMNKARLRLGVLRVYQNDFQGAKGLFRELKKEGSDWRQRTYAAHWIQRLSRYTSYERAMLNCGTRALAYLLEKEGRQSEARQVMTLLPETTEGHSMKALSDIAAHYGYDLAAIQVSPSELEALPLPAIMHIGPGGPGDRCHYWILERANEDMVQLFDPQSGRRFRQSLGEFSGEWSGRSLVFSKGETLPGTRLAEDETAWLFGGCCGLARDEDNLGDSCSRKSGPISPPDTGLPDFPPPGILSAKGANIRPPPPQISTERKTNMVNLNLFLSTNPLGYRSPVGPSPRITLSYNSQSSTAYNEPFGNKWQFNYGSYLVEDPAGNVTIFMPDGRRDVYKPDGAGGYTRPYRVFNRLTKVGENHFDLRFPDDTLYVYTVPPGTSSLQPFLVEIRDARGQGLAFGYNADVQLKTIADALGRITTITYYQGGHNDGLVKQVTGPFGRSAHFEYDANRNLTKITDMGDWTRFTYDEDVYLTSMGNERGVWEFSIEPADGVVAFSDDYPPPGGHMWESYRITVTNPSGGKEEYFYHGGCGGAVGINACGYGWYVSPRDYVPYESSSVNNFRSAPKTVYYLTSIGSDQVEIEKVTTPEGNSISYGYDPVTGDRTSITDAHGHTVNLTYNEMGRITSITDAREIATTLTYYDNGVDLFEIKNGLGTILLTYNDAHDVTSITDRLNHTTTFTYNGYGQMTSRTDAKDELDIVTTYEYDPATRLLEEVLRDGKRIAGFTHDPKDRVRTYADATGLVVTLDYNDLDKITRITYPDEKFISITYSSSSPSLIDSISDRSGRIAYFFYNGIGRLTEIINPEGGVIKLVYDPNSNPIELMDPKSHRTRFEYDLDNRPVKQTYADGKSTSITYDIAGLLKTRTSARDITTIYSYDENHNLESIAYSDGTPGATYKHDEWNRLREMQDGMGTYKFTYNANSWLETVNGPWEADALTYTYDALGRRIGLEPQGREAIAYGYDTLNRVVEVRVGNAPFTYTYPDASASPLIQSLTRPNGSHTTYGYEDPLKLLREVSNKNSAAGIINQFAYTYNEQDLRSGETITNGSPIASFQDELVTYDYNKVNQLLSATSPARTFAHDDDGNMTQGYTPEGFVFTASYDAEDRLRSLEYTDGNAVVRKTEYFYSGDWMLAQVKKYEDGNLVNDTRIVRDGFLALQERDANNNVVGEYTWGLNYGGGIGGLLNLRQGGKDYSYLYDGKGNVSALIDGTQSVVATYTYSPFGHLMAKGGSVNQPFQFSTKRYDEKTGLSYFGYRFYYPSVGRWITRDPIGFAGGINLYAFVLNNPTNFVDPLGLQWYTSPAVWVDIAALGADIGALFFPPLIYVGYGFSIANTIYTYYQWQQGKALGIDFYVSLTTTLVGFIPHPVAIYGADIAILLYDIARAEGWCPSFDYSPPEEIFPPGMPPPGILRIP